MSVEVIVNSEKNAQAKSQLDNLARRIHNRQLRLVFSKSEGKVPDEMQTLASNLLELGDALALLVYKTSQIVEHTGETFEYNLDGSNIATGK